MPRKPRSRPVPAASASSPSASFPSASSPSASSPPAAPVAPAQRRRDPVVDVHAHVSFDEHLVLADRPHGAAEYAAALKEEPHDADLWNDYAYFQYERTEYAAAEQSARKALKIDGAHKRAWVNLGLILAEQARYDDAFAAFTQAVSPAAAHNNLGIIQARQGRIDLARVELARAKQLEPTLRQPQAVLDFLAAAERGPHEPQDAEPVSSRRTKP